MTRRTPNTSRAKDSPARVKAQTAAEAVVAAEVAGATSAPHAEPGEGVTGDAEVPAGLEGAGTAAENPQPATDAEAPAFVDGGQAQEDDRAALAKAVASLGGSPATIIPKGATLDLLPPEAVPAEVVAVVICHAEAGRRRGGRRFAHGETTLTAGEASEELLAALQADPMFTVAVRPRD